MKAERKSTIRRRPPRLAAAALAWAGLLGSAAACGGDRSAGMEATEHGEGPGAHGGHARKEGLVELSAAKLAAIEIATARVERRRLAAQLETTGGTLALPLRG